MFVYAVPQAPRFKVLLIGEIPHIFVCRGEQAVFIPIRRDRTVGTPLVFDSGAVTSADVGDINGDGLDDIVLSSRQPDGEGNERSWIYWGSANGYSNNNRTAFRTTSANDVVAADDLDGNGCADVIVCQDKKEEMYTFESLIYRGSPNGLEDEPLRLETHCALDVFSARTMESSHPQVIFLNHLSNRILGDVPTYIYLGGPDGFSPERRLELASWVATEARICDFDDDGYPDIFIASCNENAMHLDKGSYIIITVPTDFCRIEGLN